MHTNVRLMKIAPQRCCSFVVLIEMFFDRVNSGTIIGSAG